MDLKKRVKKFQGELLPLLKKYELDIGAVAFLLPDGRVGARPQFIDTSKVEKKDEIKEE